MRVFRKDRLKNILNSSFFKYFFYSIGEILLIFIGVAIAIQFDEARENNERELKFEIIFNEIQEDLKQDINQLDLELNHAFRKDSLIQLVLNEQVNKNHYKSNLELQFLITSFPDFKQSNSGYENLQINKELIPEKFMNLNKKIGDIYVLKNHQLEYEISMLGDRANEWGLKIKNEKSWYWRWHRDGVQDDQIEYYISSDSYKNDVTRYHIRYIKQLLPQLIEYKKSCEELYEEIDILVKK